MKCNLSKPVRKQEKQEDDIMFFFTELSVFLFKRGHKGRCHPKTAVRAESILRAVF